MPTRSELALLDSFGICHDIQLITITVTVPVSVPGPCIFHGRTSQVDFLRTRIFHLFDMRPVPDISYVLSNSLFHQPHPTLPFNLWPPVHSQSANDGSLTTQSAIRYHSLVYLVGAPSEIRFSDSIPPKACSLISSSIIDHSIPPQTFIHLRLDYNQGQISSAHPGWHPLLLWWYIYDGF